MNSYESFESWYQDQPSDQIHIIDKLRSLVSDVSPNLVETSKWGNAAWLKKDLPIIYIHTKADHMQFGFFAGANLPDPENLLQGNGKYVRHIRINSISDINKNKFSSLIQSAIDAPPYK